MEIDRPGANRLDHWAFMSQTKALFVNNCSELVLSGEGDIIYQSLNGQGVLKEEFPVHVRITYEDITGTRYLYQVGVYYKGSVADDWLPPEVDAWGTQAALQALVQITKLFQSGPGGMVQFAGFGSHGSVTDTLQIDRFSFGQFRP